MARKDIDITGMEFGELIAKKKSDKLDGKEIAWLCECSCGNEKVISRSRLLKGVVKSCGCLRKQSPKNTRDMTGKRFGKLKVLERAGHTKKHNALWLCRCDCGNTTIAMGTSLRIGSTVSCGCENEKQIKNARDKLQTDHVVQGVQVPLITKKVRSDSSTGYKGVVRKVKKGKERFEAYITVDKKRKYVGSSTDINEVIEMRKEAEKQYYGDIIQEYNKKKGDKK